jgi:hypothetical protein
MQDSDCKKILSHIVAAEIYSNTFEQVSEIITDFILIKGDDDKVFQVCEHVNKHYFSFVSAYVDKLISDI